MKDRPRDGAAVELVALQARAVRWLSELRKADLYPYDGVKVSTAFWSFQQWYERILSHFDDAFFLPSTPHGAYYCDCVSQQDPKAGRQLRPNFVGFGCVCHA